MSTAPKNAKTAALEALIEAHAIELKLPTVRRRFRALAAEATREQQTPRLCQGMIFSVVLEVLRRLDQAHQDTRRLCPSPQKSSPTWCATSTRPRTSCCGAPSARHRPST
jgi:hypothetical protein